MTTASNNTLSQTTRDCSSSRARDLALLSRRSSDNVIRRIQAALDDAVLPQGSETGLARLAYLKDSIWTKYSDPLPGEEYVSPALRKSLAIAKWQLAEERNAATNSRLASAEEVVFRGRCNGGYRFTSTQVIHLAQKYVTSILGLRPPHSSQLHGAFTNGASTRVKRSEKTIAEKFEGRPHATAQASLLWSGEAFASPGWGHMNPEGFDVEVVKGSVMFTVPKNSQIDRVACKEPEVNSYLQRAVGLFIRRRLKRAGLDLTDQTQNQFLSSVAVSRGLATVDLSAASDSISCKLVEKLVSPEWYWLLNSLRCEVTSTPDNDVIAHHLEMFSSMGNGFTFELETLLFWALTRAISTLIRAKGRISVYGDDIICPIPTAKMLSRVFAYFGFKVNAAKSCISGGYRESCGAHSYYGTDVKPFFVRKRPRDIPDLIQITNQLGAWLSIEEDSNDVPLSLVSLWGFLATLIDPDLYGGQSFERKDSLVTGHAPRLLLRRKTKKVDNPQFGAYLAWHHSSLSRHSGSDSRFGTFGFQSNMACPSLDLRHVSDSRSSLWFNPLTESTVTVPPSFSTSVQEGKWALRSNLSWYDREVTWRIQRLVLLGLSQ